MAEDIVRSGIEISIDTASAVSQLRTLESQISQFNSRIVASNNSMRTALSANTKILQQQIGDIGQFSSQIKTIQTDVGRFSTALEKGKLSFGEYFRYGLASTKTFGKSFTRELDVINATAEDRVKRLATSYIGLGNQVEGMQKVLAVRPEIIPEGMGKDIAMAAQKQQIFNQLLRQGSTHLVNWGKNTQWAGRQLMVGFTIPLTIFGTIASKIFMDLERQAINFRRVYGDAFTPTGETDAMLEEVKTLSIEFTKYGISASETMDMAAKAAATGAQGADLIAATTEATRLATLGQIDQQQALDATIALQSAFSLSSTELAESVNFLNAVENQTIVSLDDVTQAIPRAATVVKGLGGDVRDLSAFLAAMRENGVNAAEGANALKSGLASLVNPTKQAREQLEAVGINIDTIIETNRGDLMGTVQAFGQAVNALDPLTRQQTLAQVFGKYQFARLGALFENITKDGSQASRVLQLMGDDVSSLAALADKELGTIEDAIGVKFQGAVERLKISIAPVGEIFLRIATPIIEAVTKVVNAFNDMPNAIKIAIAAVVGILAGVAPVFLMGVGLIGNGIGNMIKGFDVLRNIYQKMTGKVTGSNGPLTQSFGFMTNAELDAAAAAGVLDGQLSGLTGTALLNREAIDGLTGAYTRFAKSMQQGTTNRPQAIMANLRGRRMAKGGFVPGKGNSDTEPAILTPGEFVVNKEATERFAPILVAMNQGTIQGYNEGSDRPIGTSRFVPAVSSTSDIPQSNRSILEFGHSAGFAAGELKSTVASLSETADQIRMLGDNASDADKAFLDLLDTVLNTEKTFVKFEQAADGSWQATEVATKALKDLSLEAESAASLGQFGGGRITSGTRNEALKQIRVDEPISFADLTIAAQQAESKLLQVANGAAEMQMPFQYALQGVIDEYNMLEGDLQAQSRYLLDNTQAMIRDGLMTDKKVSAEAALATSLEKRQAIESDLIRTGAMLNGEIVDSVKAQKVVEAYLFDYADSLAISSNTQVAKRASMSATGSSDAGKILQPRFEGTRTKIFSTPASRRAVAERLTSEGLDVGREIGVYLGPAIGDGISQGIDANSPPPWSFQLGEWIAEGIQRGAKGESQSSRLSVAYPSMPIKPFEIDPQITKNIQSLSASAAKAAVASDKDAIATNMEAAAHIENTVATNAESNAKKKGMGGFRSMLYALDGLSLAMSFLPGPLGEIANKVFIASAALSAFDAIMRIEIIQGALRKFSLALTAAATASGLKAAGQGVSSAVSTGADLATAAALAKRAGPAGRAGGLIARLLGPLAKFGAVIGRLLPALGRLALAVGRFVGIIVNGIPGVGQILSAIILVATAIAGFAFAYKNAGDRVRDLGEAARVAGDDLKSIAEKFGFSERTTGFANQGTVLGRTEEARTVAQEARTFVQEDSSMQGRIEKIRGATDVSAEAIFRSMFMDLVAGGAPKDVATAIVEAVALEAGKQKAFIPVNTDITLSFDDEGKIKDIGAFIKNSLTPSVDILQESLDNLGKEGFNNIIDQGAVDDAKRWMAAVDMFPEFIKKAIVPQYEQKKAILETASSVELLKTNTQTAMNLLSAEFVNGRMDLEQFNLGMQEIYTSLSSLPNNQGLQIIKEQLITLYPESQATISSIDDAKIAFDLLSLAAQGVNMSGFIQEMERAGMSAAQVRAELDALMSTQASIMAGEANIARIEAELAKEQAKPGDKKGKGGGSGGGGGVKDPFAGREDEIRDEQARITIKEINIDRTAEDRLERKLETRFGDTSITVGNLNIDMETFEDVEIAIDLIGEKIEDIERGPLQAAEDDIKRINDEIAIFDDQLEVINRDIELQEQAIRRIEEEYKPILDSLEDQKRAQEDILQSLEDQRDAAVRTYEDQIAVLERQMRVAEQAAKPRLDALEDEEKSLDTQTEALDGQIESIDKQKDALSEVSKMNEKIARQQKNRLNITQALAEGDIYAATAAAQQMKQDATDDAVEQQQDAFDAQKKSLEDQKKLIEDRKELIEAERDAIQEGLDAIQDQIDAQEYQRFLIEDSYRLSIQAANDASIATDREISKQTALRDARIKPYRDIIDSYAPQIDAINNSIYLKEQEIKKIQEERIKPLEDQILALQRQKEVLDDIKGDAEAEIARDKAALERRKNYLDQELQILGARKEIADLESGGGGGTAGTKGTRDKDKIAALEAELEAARKELEANKAELPEAGLGTDSSWYTGLIGGAQSAWSGFTTWFNENVITPIKNGWSSITTWFNENVINPITGAWDGLKDDFIAIKDTFLALFTAIGELFYDNVIVPIKAKWDNFFATTIQPKIDGLVAAWETVRSTFETKFNEIKTFFISWWNTNIQPKLDVIAGWWETVRSAFVTKFNEIKTFFISWWDTNIQPKIDAFLNMWQTIKDSFVAKFTEIGDWWDEWKQKTFDDKVAAMKQGLASLFDPETWKGWFTSAVGGILTVGKKLVNSLAGMFSNIKFSIPDWIPWPWERSFGIDISPPFPDAGTFFKGGMVDPYIAGGSVLGSGSRDSVSAMLSPGEFVVRKAMVDKYGTPMFDAINQGSFVMPKYETPQSGMGSVSVKSENTSNILAPMYNNYSVSVNVSGSNASADEIANKTIMKIKQMQDTRIRSGRGY